MNKKNIFLSLTIVTCTLCPLPTRPTSDAKASQQVISKESKAAVVEREIESIERKKKHIEAQKKPRIRGFFVPERRAILALTEELQLLQLEVKQALLEAKNALLKEDNYPFGLMRAATHLLQAATVLLYTLCGISIVLAIVYTTKKLSS